MPEIWKVEIRLLMMGWTHIASLDNEAEAIKRFEWALEDYPADYLVRLCEAGEVRRLEWAGRVADERKPLLGVV